MSAKPVRMFAVLLVGALGVVGAILAASAGRGPQPEIHAPKQQKHVTIMAYGDSDAFRSFDFEIQNRGRKPLRISKATVSCGCSTAEFPEQIDPGGSGIVRLGVSIPRGVVDTKTIQCALESNAGNRRVLPLHLTISAQQAWTISPRRIDFGAVVAGQAVEREVVITRLLAVDLPSVDRFDKGPLRWIPGKPVQFAKGGRHHQRVEGMLRFSAPTAPGTFYDELRFPMDGQNDMSVTCLWTVEPDLYTLPSELSLRPGPGGETPSAECAVILAKPRLAISNIEYDKDIVAVNLSKRTDQEYLLVATLQPGAKHGNPTTVVTVRSAEGKSYTIPVRIVSQ